MTIQIVVRFSLPGLHCWPDAPAPVEYLADFHRHQFWFECTAQVRHCDRDLEFILLQKKLKNQLRHKYWNDDKGLLVLGSKSCEDLALELLCSNQELCRCSVFEDGENGSVVER